MAPSCVVDPIDCILYDQRVIFKRAPEDPVSDPGGDASSSPNKTVVIVAASVGSVVLLLCLALFYICMRRRRASRRIGQLAQFLPTFMDKEKTEKYFQAQGSSSTLVPPPEPSNVHHRARSAPIAFAKGVTDHRNRQLERDGSMGQFQQISLLSEEYSKDNNDEALRRSTSLGTRQRSSSIAATAAPAQVAAVSSLHRSTSLNKHRSASPSGRTLVAEDLYGSPPAGAEVIPGPNNTSRFAEGESVHNNNNNNNNNSHNMNGPYDSNRYSAILDFKLNQGLSPDADDGLLHHEEDDGTFDPTRFSTASVMFDAKRISNLSTASSDDTMSTSSSDEFKHLPPHQKHHSFHSHHASPVIKSRELSEDSNSHEGGHNTGNNSSSSGSGNVRPAFLGGEKQEILDDEDELQIASRQPAPISSSSSPSLSSSRALAMGSIPDKQEYDEELEPVPVMEHHSRSGSPLPPRIVLSQPQSGQNAYGRG
ncbi:hypothetical protein BG004_003387 [Podila humilis]|nr:hypothetical protein BG004_003387 [Podila humilis]